MSFLSKVGGALGIKALKDMVFPGRSMIFFDFPKADLTEMAEEVGNGTGSDIVMTPVRWLQRAMQESELAVFVDDEKTESNDLVELIENPNPFYGADLLLAGTVFSLSTSGNAYWIIARNDSREARELWWVPSDNVEPKWPDDGRTFISHYVYKVGGEERRLETEDVIHFRDGVDPDNIRKGLSPLRGLLREIWTDNEAAIFTASLMRNGGVPGMIISPKDKDAVLTAAQAEQAKAKMEEVTRRNRGKPIVMTGPTIVETFGFSPAELDLSPLRDVSEERVTAALGIPAAVVGFGAGLQSTKVGATMRELRQMAWHNGVIPMQRIIEGTLQTSLMSELRIDGKVRFDNTDVAALSDDANKHFERVERMVKCGIWTRAEAREETGREANAGDDVYLMPFNVVTVPVGTLPVTDPPKTIIRKDHSLLERTVAERPQHAPPDALLRLARSFDAVRTALPAAFETELMTFFSSIGEAAERVALDVLGETRSNDNAERKVESLDAERIAAGMELLGHERALKQLFERHYLRVGGEASDILAQFFGLEVGLADPAARALIATGGTRAGLIDLSNKTRRRIFERLVEGRIEGRAGDSLARFIRDGVEAGPWSSPAVRAKVIARTETAFATNVATVEAARSIEGVERMMILDARAGATDEVCERLNGVVVTIDEARQLVEDEHPQGTRSAVPITQQLAEEMGL